MKSRRVILTIEVETDLPLAELRRVHYMECSDKEGFLSDPLYRRHDAVHRIVQVQANAIRQERKAKRAKGAK